MLNTGIVGLKNTDQYIDVLVKHPAFQFTGIFDPSLFVENPVLISKNFPVFSSFDEMCLQCHAIVFSSDDKIYLPFIEKALRRSVAVFVESVQNLSIKELQVLQKLKDEAKGILQIGHPYLYAGLFAHLKEKNPQPLDIQSTYSDPSINNLMGPTRAEISSILMLLKTNIRKVSVNVFSSFSEIPDMVRVRLDFDNGSVGNILVNKYDFSPVHKMRVLGYDHLTEICIITQHLTYIDPNCLQHPLTIDLNNYHKTSFYNQFDAFCSKIFGLPCNYNSIENEIKTQWVMERIKEKLRLSLNIF